MFFKTLPLTTLVWVIISCGNPSQNTSLNKSENEWTQKNKDHFLSNCTNYIDKTTCICILENMIVSGRDVIEIGEMKQNEFMDLAKDCVDK